MFGNKPGLLLEGNPRYFVPFTVCSTTGLWLIRLLPPPTLHNRIYPVNNAEDDDSMSQALTQQDMRMQNHERLGHASFKRIRQIEVKGLPKPPSKRMKPITCPVCITAKARSSEEEPSIAQSRPRRSAKPVSKFKTTHRPRPPRTKTKAELRWESDPDYRAERKS